MILVYTKAINNRVNYAFDLIFGTILQVPVDLTDDQRRFLDYDGPKISYCDEPVKEEFNIHPARLLYENDVYEQNIEVFEWEGMKCFFKTQDESDFPFDPFAAAFFLVTRYEEYLPHIRDEFGRFRPWESISHKSGFLERPIVDVWAHKLKKAIQDRHPEFPFPRKQYRFISTIDVDTAYAYKQKGVMRTLGGMARSLLVGRSSEVRDRFKVLLGGKHDPFDTFDYLIDLHNKKNIEAVFFFLLADYGLNDKNIPVTSQKFRSLIKHVADYSKVGIHPSFNSNYDPEKLRVEINRLADIFKREVLRSRQHFLIVDLPDTYRRVLDLGIKEEFSMGYVVQPGFRAGTCTPYYHYDLEKEVVTKLKVFPLTAMEVTMKHHLKLGPEEAIEYFRKLNEEVRNVNGTFLTLWHNDTLCEEGEWKGWSKVYEEVLNMASTQ